LKGYSSDNADVTSFFCLLVFFFMVCALRVFITMNLHSC